MDTLHIYSLVKNLESYDIYTLLKNRGIAIYHKPEMFRCLPSDARIITDLYGNTSIFLRFRPGEKPRYEVFILWHELGHIEVEGRMPYSRSYNLSTHSANDEADSNLFAFFGTTRSHSKLSDTSEDIASQLGMPMVILESVMNRINNDEEFMNYLNEETK